MQNQLLVMVVFGLFGLFLWARQNRRNSSVVSFHERYGGMANTKALPPHQPMDLQAMVDELVDVRSMDVGNVSLPRTPVADDLDIVSGLLESKGHGRVDGITIVRSSRDVDENIWYEVDAVIETVGAARFVIVNIQKTGRAYVVSAQETALRELPYDPKDAMPYDLVTTTVPVIDYSKYI